MLAQGFLRAKGHAKITKCYFLWVGAVNMQSLSGHYAPISIHGVFTSFSYLGAVAYISVEISLGSCWHRDILRVKGQAFSNCNFLWLCVICNTHGVFTSFSLSKCCCLHFCRNKFGLLLRQGYFKGKRSRVNHKFATFYDLMWYAII